jgi:hypothetical protein
LGAAQRNQHLAGDSGHDRHCLAALHGRKGQTMRPADVREGDDFGDGLAAAGIYRVSGRGLANSAAMS